MKQATKAEIITQAVLPLFNEATRRLKDMDRYCVYYTHGWEQGNDENQNILVLPSDPRFDKLEFIGMVLDMIRDYSDKTGWDLKGSPEINALTALLKKLENGEEL